MILFGLALMTAGSLIMALEPPLSVFSAAPTQRPSGPAHLPGPGGKWAESAGTVSAAFEFAACVTVLAILGVFVFLPLSRRV